MKKRGLGGGVTNKKFNAAVFLMLLLVLKC